MKDDISEIERVFHKFRTEDYVEVSFVIDELEDPISSLIYHTGKKATSDFLRTLADSIFKYNDSTDALRRTV